MRRILAAALLQALEDAWGSDGRAAAFLLSEDARGMASIVMGREAPIWRYRLAMHQEIYKKHRRKLWESERARL